jgi:hypothetical protein
VSLPVPCLHRIVRGELRGVMRIHRSLGMVVELAALERRLAALDARATHGGLAERSVFVTFDDGWTDPLHLIPSFERWSRLQPVLFLTAAQLAGDRSLLPLPRLYQWCADTGTPLAVMRLHGLCRRRLKTLPQVEQHRQLDRLGIPRIERSNEVMDLAAVRRLMARGWLVGWTRGLARTPAGLLVGTTAIRDSNRDYYRVLARSRVGRVDACLTWLPSDGGPAVVLPLPRGESRKVFAIVEVGETGDPIEQGG